MPYKSTASGYLYPPTDEDFVNDIERAKSELDEAKGDTPIPAASQSVKVDEMYYDDGELTVKLIFGDWYASADIPLRPSDGLHSLLDDINEDFGTSPYGSGYFLAADDIGEIVRTTPDSQGRVTVGRQYANTPVTLCIAPDERVKDTRIDDVTGILHNLYGSNPQAAIHDLDIDTLAERLAEVYDAETVNTAIDALGWDTSEHGL